MNIIKMGIDELTAEDLLDDERFEERFLAFSKTSKESDLEFCHIISSDDSTFENVKSLYELEDRLVIRQKINISNKQIHRIFINRERKQVNKYDDKTIKAIIKAQDKIESDYYENDIYNNNDEDEHDINEFINNHV